MTQPTLDKVVAFVVTGEPVRLLVFEHPTAGLQLPKGTVEHSETRLQAVRREVFEETGVQLTGDGRELGTEERALGDGGGVILRTTEAEDTTFHRGRLVDVVDASCEAGEVRVREQHFDYGQSPPAVIRSYVGTVPFECVGRRIRHTFFAFREEARRTRPWTREADGHMFEVDWRALEGLSLHEKQMAWLDAWRDELAPHL